MSKSSNPSNSPEIRRKMEGDLYLKDPVVPEIHRNPKKSSPEGIGKGEDSGFASITGSLTADHPENDERPKIAEAPIFRTKEERERLRQEQMAAKRQAEIQYEIDKREKAYKRLMHLLKQSKFFSDFLVKKLSEKDSRPAKDPTSKSAKRKISDSEGQQSPPAKRTRRGKRNSSDDLKENLIPQLKRRMRGGKLNLSEEEIQAELEAIREEDDEPEDNAEFVQPRYFQGDLRDYQKHGLQWLKALYENGMSGILADEMGLGKTIQVIAMICHLIEKRQDGPYLILAPLSTIPNWLMEFERFAPKIPVVLYYGTREERAKQAQKLKKMATVEGFRTLPVILTTYETPIKDKRVIKGFKWRYIIIDEAQRIKNSECQLMQVLKGCNSISRLLLTGTPLQNNLKELWSLLHFLMPQIFTDLAVFESWFDVKDFQHEEGTNRILQQEEEKNVLQSLREILKPFMLRRIKTDVCLDIPAKQEVMVYAPMSELQRQLYRAYLDRDIHTMFKTKPEPVILDDEFGNRPKRRCASNNRYSGVYKNPYQSCQQDTVFSSDEDPIVRSASPDPDYVASSSDSSGHDMNQQLLNFTVNETAKQEVPSKTAAVEKAMENWNEHVQVTEDNCQYLFRLSFGNRSMMYRKIINHPYLIHLPLNDAGLPKVDDDLITASGKFVVLDRMLKKLKEGGHKVLLFSTMKMILDVIEDYLGMRPWKYLRLDGDVDIETRKRHINAFNSESEYFLFLISTRAGGVGVNLAAADTVIIFDSDWNPQVDIQAMARCHRIGQTRPVVIYRLCTKGTFDEAIVSRAEAKRKLEKLVISKEVEQLSVMNKEGLLKLKQLLESSEQQVGNAGKEFLSDEEFEKLLDRSHLAARNPAANETDISLTH